MPIRPPGPRALPALADTVAVRPGTPCTFYVTVDGDSVRPYMPAVPVLLPASSFARRGFRTPKLPDRVVDRAADSGGYVATLKWGDYRYTPEVYRDWLRTWRPTWAATMDYCCEPEVLGSGVVQERQDRTTAMAHRFWEDFGDEPWAWVPTVQGWTASDYRRHARDLAPLVGRMAAHYGPDRGFRVGVGTLCRRASAGLIRDVVQAVREELPGVPLHLWGVKLGLLTSPGGLPPGVISVDSAAWNGLIKSDRYAWAFHRDHGMTQREYSYFVALPAYLAKIDAALAATRPLPLF